MEGLAYKGGIGENGEQGQQNRENRAYASRQRAVSRRWKRLAGDVLRGVVALLLATLLATLFLSGAVGLGVLGEGHGHGSGHEREAKHQRHQFLHCGSFSPCY